MFVIIVAVMKMKKMEITKGKIILYMITFLVIVLGDQMTKLIVDKTLNLGTGYSIIDNFFYFTYVHNSGAAWGILEGKMILFFLVSIIAAVGIVYYFLQTHSYQQLTRFGLVLVFSGMIGNLIDRIVLGYVRDFIDFIILGYNFPVFNVADMAIVIGVILIIIELSIEEYKAWKLSKSK